MKLNHDCGIEIYSYVEKTLHLRRGKNDRGGYTSACI